MSVKETDSTVVSRYVRALFEVGAGREADFLNQMKAIRIAIKSLKGYEKFLKRFSLIVSEGEIFVNTLITELELFQEIGNFLKVVLHNKRFSIILDICNAYERLYDQMNDKKVFYITYAREFTEKMKTELSQYLQELVGGNIEFVAHQDSSLIGGLQIRYGSKILDYSVRSKLNRLKKIMKAM